jgi:hypothetical protein
MVTGPFQALYQSQRWHTICKMEGHGARDDGEGDEGGLLSGGARVGGRQGFVLDGIHGVIKLVGTRPYQQVMHEPSARGRRSEAYLKT